MKKKRKYPKSRLAKALAVKVLARCRDTATGATCYVAPYAGGRWPTDGTWKRPRFKVLRWCRNGIHACASVQAAIECWSALEFGRRVFIIDLRGVRQHRLRYGNRGTKVMAERGRIVSGPVKREPGETWTTAILRELNAVAKRPEFAKHAVLR